MTENADLDAEVRRLQAEIAELREQQSRSGMERIAELERRLAECVEELEVRRGRGDGLEDPLAVEPLSPISPPREPAEHDDSQGQDR